MTDRSAVEQLMLDVHHSTTDNKLQVHTDHGAMCGYCLKESKYEQIRWTGPLAICPHCSTGPLAICPHCSTDCMIPLSVAHRMSRESKEAFRKYWFGI